MGLLDLLNSIRLLRMMFHIGITKRDGRLERKRFFFIRGKKMDGWMVRYTLLDWTFVFFIRIFPGCLFFWEGRMRHVGFWPCKKAMWPEVTCFLGFGGRLFFRFGFFAVDFCYFRNVS